MTASHNTHLPPQPSAYPAESVLEALSTREDEYEDVRHTLLNEILKAVPFDGWTPNTLNQCANLAGLRQKDITLAFPDGVVDILNFWAEQTDRTMLKEMAKDSFKSLKIREKVSTAILVRLRALEHHKEAARRAAATLALPPYALTGSKLVWRTADRIWRGLGDSSTDFNYYSKRTILSAVWTSTFTRWLADESEDHTETGNFLDERIANVMQFEKLKTSIAKQDLDPGKVISETIIPALSRLRYPEFR